MLPPAAVLQATPWRTTQTPGPPAPCWHCFLLPCLPHRLGLLLCLRMLCLPAVPAQPRCTSPAASAGSRAAAEALPSPWPRSAASAAHGQNARSLMQLESNSSPKQARCAWTLPGHGDNRQYDQHHCIVRDSAPSPVPPSPDPACSSSASAAPSDLPPAAGHKLSAPLPALSQRAPSAAEGPGHWPAVAPAGCQPAGPADLLRRPVEKSQGPAVCGR